MYSTLLVLVSVSEQDRTSIIKAVVMNETFTFVFFILGNPNCYWGLYNRNVFSLTNSFVWRLCCSHIKSYSFVSSLISFLIWFLSSIKEPSLALKYEAVE